MTATTATATTRITKTPEKRIDEEEAWLTAHDVVPQLRKTNQVRNSPIVIIPVDINQPKPTIDYSMIKPIAKDKPITLVNFPAKSNLKEPVDPKTRDYLNKFLARFQPTLTKTSSVPNVAVSTRPPFRYQTIATHPSVVEAPKKEDENQSKVTLVVNPSSKVKIKTSQNGPSSMLEWFRNRYFHNQNKVNLSERVNRPFGSSLPIKDDGNIDVIRGSKLKISLPSKNPQDDSVLVKLVNRGGPIVSVQPTSKAVKQHPLTPSPVNITSDSIKTLWTKEVIKQVLEHNKDIIDKDAEIPDYRLSESVWSYRNDMNTNENVTAKVKGLSRKTDEDMVDVKQQSDIDEDPSVNEIETGPVADSSVPTTARTSSPGTERPTAATVATATKTTAAAITPRPGTLAQLAQVLSHSVAPLAGLSAASLAYGAAATLPVWLPLALGKKRRRRHMENVVEPLTNTEHIAINSINRRKSWLS